MSIKLAENIKHFRESKGLTQSELADYLCVTPQSVSRWEKGQAYPDIEKLPQIANLFEVSIDKLMGNSKPALYDISQELVKVRKKLNENTQEIRYEYFDLLEQSVNIGSNRFLCEYYRASQKMARDRLVTEQKHTAVTETVRKKLLEMSTYERINALTVLVANEDEAGLSQWEDFIGNDNNRACWRDILLLRYFIRKEENGFTAQRCEVLFEDISKTLFLMNQKSAPNSGAADYLNYFGTPDTVDNCLLVKNIIALLSTRDDDIFIFLRVTAETRLASTYMMNGEVESVLACLERIKELLAVCKNMVGKSVSGSIGLFKNYQIVAEEYKYENLFHEIEVMLMSKHFTDLKQTDKRFVDFETFIEEFHGSIDPFCYLPWPERKSFETMYDRSLALAKRTAKNELSYSMVVETEKGNVYETVIGNGDERESEVRLFTEILKNNKDTAIKYIVGILYDSARQYCLEMPSFFVRDKLYELNKANLNACILLQGLGAFIQKPLRSLFSDTMQLKYE